MPAEPAPRESDPVERPRRPGRSRYVDSYPEGRICAEPGCSTRLSRYNKALRCAAHEDPRTGQLRLPSHGR